MHYKITGLKKNDWLAFFCKGIIQVNRVTRWFSIGSYLYIHPHYRRMIIVNSFLGGNNGSPYWPRSIWNWWNIICWDDKRKGLGQSELFSWSQHGLMWPLISVFARCWLISASGDSPLRTGSPGREMSHPVARIENWWMYIYPVLAYIVSLYVRRSSTGG